MEMEPLIPLEAGQHIRFDLLGDEGEADRFYKCSNCGLVVEDIPEFKPNECSKGVQHVWR